MGTNALGLNLVGFTINSVPPSLLMFIQKPYGIWTMTTEFE
jgi:hypothetical protein